MLIQLQPDIIIAKQSRQITSLITSTLENSFSIASQNTAFLDRTSPPAESLMTKNQTNRHFANPWSFSSLFGTIAYSRRSYRSKAGYGDRKIVDAEEREETIIEIRAPSWLINRAWRIQAIKARSGWTFRPRTYNEIPEDSIVFQLIKEDDVKGLQELFVRNEASPFDCRSNGFTVLHVCVTSFIDFVDHSAK